MDKKTKIIVIVVAVVLLAGTAFALWYFLRDEETKETETVKENKKTEKTNVDKINGAIDGGQQILNSILG